MKKLFIVMFALFVGLGSTNIVEARKKLKCPSGTGYCLCSNADKETGNGYICSNTSGETTIPCSC